MLENIKQQLALYKARQQALKHFSKTRYQDIGLSQHLARDLNADQLDQTMIRETPANKVELLDRLKSTLAQPMKKLRQS